jgi:hypothetical protein
MPDAMSSTTQVNGILRETVMVEHLLNYFEIPTSDGAEEPCIP